MKIILNGEQAEITQTISVHDLLKIKNIEPVSVVVELNGMILEKGSLEQIKIDEGDKIEIIKFVGGG